MNGIKSGAYAPGTHPDLAPPPTEIGLRGWLYHNLFSGWVNSAVTIASGLLLVWILGEVLPWLFFDAYWRGDDRSACPAPGEREGACWVYIKVWFKQLMYGRYPQEMLWRINAAYVLLAGGLIPLIIPHEPESLFSSPTGWRKVVGAIMGVLLVLSLLVGAPVWFPAIFFWVGVGLFVGYGFVLAVGYPVMAVLLFLVALPLHPHLAPAHGGWAVFLAVLLSLQGLMAFGNRLWPRFSYKAALAAMMLAVFPIVCLYLFSGDALGLEEVETPLWGGLFLTLVIALTGIVASLPLGVVLALGRRSNMPVVKSVCVVFIEMWRGVPLITVLFMASVMFPLFMPEGVNFDKLLRALLGVMFFASAYMAEVVRGGLQAIPKGQYEAADAVGLSYWKSMGLVILPQALKIVIPGIVNTFIGLFKDTTLVLIIGLFDFLGMAQAVATNPDWLGFYVEGYIFVAFGFWVFCFGMSRYSIYLENKLQTGHRR
jgi:general L-amino acid transport system permease protein